MERLQKVPPYESQLGTRFQAVRGNTSQYDFASLLGVNKNLLGRYERGETMPGAAFLARFHQITGVDITWLLTGEGEMRRGEAEPPPPAIDSDLMGLVLEAVKAIYKAENARICDRDAGKLAAQIYAEALPLTGGSTDIDDRKAAIRVVTVKLRNSLATTAEPLDNKRLA